MKPDSDSQGQPKNPPKSEPTTETKSSANTKSPSDETKPDINVRVPRYGMSLYSEFVDPSVLIKNLEAGRRSDILKKKKSEEDDAE